MSNLEDTVRLVVESFVNGDESFTALDVSNKVKVQLPHARHREVRDVVRSMFQLEIEPKGWARSPIVVNLDDGTTAEALLYHPLSASWDLDNRYDQQKRSQVAVDPSKVAAAAVAAATVVAPITQPSSTASVTVSATTSVPMPTARDLWKQLFATQPSLFPTK